MDLEPRNESRRPRRAGPPTIHPYLTGSKVQRVLLTVSIALFICGYVISRHEGRLSQAGHPQHRFHKEVGFVKYLYFAFSVLILIWFFYDIYVYHPWYRRCLRRGGQLRTGLRPPQRLFHETGPSGIRQLPELETSHPLVEGLRDLREGMMANLRYREALKLIAVPTPPPLGPMPRKMSLKQFEEWQAQKMADDWRDVV